nr:nicotinate-nucleotide--dimethylbenzimidazole phosphoribosyltransferase [Millisia brevis]
MEPPDREVYAEAERYQLRLTKPAGSLGRLEELGCWVASCQGVCPPRPITSPRIVVFAGDHGVTGRGVSAYPSEVTAQMVANMRAGGAAISILGAAAGASVRVVDIAVDTAPDGSGGAGDGTDGSGADEDDPTRYKIRRSSGSIDTEDALSPEELIAAIDAGRAIAAEEIDAGGDLLVAGDMGIGNTTIAAVLIAVLTDNEPTAVIGRGTGIDDNAWMRKAAVIRDAMWRARAVRSDPGALLAAVGGADYAAMAGFLAEAAARRVPAILDGVVVTAAAMMADRLAPGARRWWVAGHRSAEPAHTFALERLDLEPLLDYGMRLGEGSGAALAIPIVRAAAAVTASMATFPEAGVSERAADDVGATPDGRDLLDAT